MKLFDTIARKALFTLDAETAHGLTIEALKTGMVPCRGAVRNRRLKVSLAGLDFDNPVGLAAGFDKNGEVPDAMLKLGFGFTEVGTITPRPQTGNPKPRVFRLIEDKGIINRLGFNNEGHQAALARLQARKSRGGIVGINIGANKDSEDFVADYEKGIETFSHLASYFTVNISSPNTPGLRNLQGADALRVLLDRVFSTHARQANKPPVFLKLAPDLEESEIEEIAEVINQSALSGVMVSNTTLSRKTVAGRKNAAETGGLSGSPVFERSTIILAKFRQRVRADIPLIGIGGVKDGKTAWAKLEAGASLVQLYSCMVYEGPNIARNICQGLVGRMEAEGLQSLESVTARKTDEWANRSLDNL